MNRFFFLFAGFSSLILVGCSSDDSVTDDTGESAEVGILPQAGEWPISTTGWTNDDCNAAEGLTPATSILFADVEETSFMTTYFDPSGQVGNTTLCSYDGDDAYTCSEFVNGFSYTDVDATISMTGVGTVTMMSEDSAAGRADFVLECTGAGCGQVAAGTNSGSFPCGSTFNWTAQAN